jgi:hypothetical protein
MSCSVAPGCHTKVKLHLFSANYQFYVRTLTTPVTVDGRAARGRPPPTRARARAPSRAPLDVRFSGLCVRAGVRSEHFQVEIGQIVLTSRHWKPV